MPPLRGLENPVAPARFQAVRRGYRLLVADCDRGLDPGRDVLGRPDDDGAAAKDYSANDLDDFITKNVAAIKPLVEDLESRGCRVTFFELPYPGPARGLSLCGADTLPDACGISRPEELARPRFSPV